MELVLLLGVLVELLVDVGELDTHLVEVRDRKREEIAVLTCHHCELTQEFVLLLHLRVLSECDWSR